MYRLFFRQVIKRAEEYDFLCIRIFKDALHHGIWVEVFDIWFDFMEEVSFTGLVDIVHWYHEADMADMTWFFDRTNGIMGIFLLQETRLPW